MTNSDDFSPRYEDDHDTDDWDDFLLEERQSPVSDPPGRDEIIDQTESEAEVLIRRAIHIIEGAKSVPLSASVLVSREELTGLLEEALALLPQELAEAKVLLRERETFLTQSKREGENILEEARTQAERMVQRTEIVRQANHVAQRIMDDARAEASRLRHEAEDYCDKRLAAFEIILDKTMKSVRAGREKLQITVGRHSAGTDPIKQGSVYTSGTRAPESPVAGSASGTQELFDQDEVDGGDATSSSS
ncbi:MAG: ATP synthase F0 subunit B [Actinobacteria bacterium]|jgi:F0F1-type ATP synthase membrane subunit b/b'|nr:ATP synthase F0 subunit B [Actinomycetota bacterium]MCL6094547.1 ATP synthase F0 subunit B [Actinomycetota bacterium]